MPKTKTKSVHAMAAREREIVERARANAPLMEQFHRSLESYRRGEPAIAWEDVQAEAQPRSGRVSI